MSRLSIAEYEALPKATRGKAEIRQGPQKSEAEDHLVRLLEESRWCPAITREHRFHPERKWRFDVALVSVKLAIEVEGGGQLGRHARPAGFRADAAKYAEAQILGWSVFRFPREMVMNGDAIGYVRRWLNERAKR